MQGPPDELLHLSNEHVKEFLPFLALADVNVLFHPVLMALSRLATSSTTRRGHGYSGGEHWSQRLTRENKELKSLNALLLERLRQLGDDTVVEIQGMEKTTVPIMHVGNNPDPNPNDEPDDEPSDNPSENEDEGNDFNVKVKVFYQNKCYTFMFENSDITVHHVSMVLVGFFRLWEKYILLRVKTTGEVMVNNTTLSDYLHNEPDHLMLEVLMTTQNMETLDNFIDVGVVQDFGSRNTHNIKVLMNMPLLDFKFVLQGLFNIPMPYLKLIAGNEVLYNEDLTLFEYDITTNNIIRVGIGLLGGAPAKKRKPTLSAMKPAEDDDLRVKACFGLTHFNETAWVESLSQKVRQEYLEVLEKNRNYTSQIDATVSRIREFSILKDCVSLTCRHYFRLGCL